MTTLLHHDFETRSATDLGVATVFRYAADPTTSVLCAAYAVDNGPVRLWTPDQPVPPEFIEAAQNPDWIIVAHNDQFERVIAEQVLRWPVVPIERRICTMAMALASALPASLEDAAAALELSFQKDLDGQRLMRQMSRPRRPRKGEDPAGIYWVEDVQKRERLYGYSRADVEAERALFHRLLRLSPDEQALWMLDARINERGFAVDVALAEAAREIVRHEQDRINAEIAALTGGGITSACQVGKIQTLLRERGHAADSLTKRAVSAVLAGGKCSEETRRLLELRRERGRASVRKLDSLLAGIDGDGRLRGTLRYHGAATGRWSGTRFQPQNLKKPEIRNLDVDVAMAAILARDIARVRGLGDPLAAVGGLQRLMIQVAPDHVLIGDDFSAIESRVLAWLAGGRG